MNFNFTAIDFETANPLRGSVCAVGAVKVRAGQIVNEYSTLVRPPAGMDEFTAMQQRIHGIGPTDVSKAPAWTGVYPILADMIDGDEIVAHNAEFDTSVLREACRAHDIVPPVYFAHCTKRLAQAFLSLPSYKLPAVARHLGLPRFRHHEPLADARATAQVLLAIAAREKIYSIEVLKSSGAANSGTNSLPEYVLPQSKSATASTYNQWLRACLANPRGRATGGEECVICRQPIDRSLHWQLREQHVCGHTCSGKLKRDARKMWRVHGIEAPR